MLEELKLSYFKIERLKIMNKFILPELELNFNIVMQ